MHISLARLASFCHIGFISDPLIVSNFHNETHDPKGQENKIYTIVKGRETSYQPIQQLLGKIIIKEYVNNVSDFDQEMPQEEITDIPMVPQRTYTKTNT